MTTYLLLDPLGACSFVLAYDYRDVQQHIGGYFDAIPSKSESKWVGYMHEGPTREDINIGYLDLAAYFGFDSSFWLRGKVLVCAGIDSDGKDVSIDSNKQEEIIKEVAKCEELFFV